MNWSRAKTILIVAFLILDLFLIGQMVGQQETHIPVEEYVAINNTAVNLLEAKYGIITEVSLPIGTQTVITPEVSWQGVDGQVLAEAFWPGEDYQVSGAGIYSFDEELLFLDNQMYYYWNEDISKRIISNEDIITGHIPLAIKDSSHKELLLAPLLKANLSSILGIDFNDWILDEITPVVENDEVYYDIYFIQEIGLPVYDAGSYTRVRLDNSGRVCGVKRAVLVEHKKELTPVDWVKEQLSITPQTKIISAAEALLSFVGYTTVEEGSIIKDVKLAYFGLTESSLMQAGQMPAKWQLIPVWRVKIEDPDGKKHNYFLNAYTGKIE